MDNKERNPKKVQKKSSTTRTNKNSKMDLKKRDRLIVIAIIAIIIITIAVIVVAVVFKGKVGVSSNTPNSAVSDTNTENAIVKEDGSKENTSSKIKGEKDFDGMKVKDVRIISQGGLSNFVATVENTSNQEKGDKPITVKFVNKNNEEISSLEAYLGSVSGGSNTTIDASATSDISNAYDYIIEYK